MFLNRCDSRNMSYLSGNCLLDNVSPRGELRVKGCRRLRSLKHLDIMTCKTLIDCSSTAPFSDTAL